MIPNSPHEVAQPENEDKKDERRRIVVALLFLLLTFLCVFCSSNSALYFIDRDKIDGGIKARDMADYSLQAPLALAPLDRDRILAEIIADEEALKSMQTPLAGSSVLVAVLPNATPAAVAQIIPSPTLTPSISVPSTATPAPQPTATPTSLLPTSQPTPSPTVSQPTAVVPSPTPTTQSQPTVVSSPTALPTATDSPAPTVSVPTNTPQPPPTATSEPPPDPTSTPLPSNNAPNANNDSASLPEDNSIDIPVLSNDTDSDGTIVFSSLAIVTPPSNGTATANTTTGEITYTPFANYSGSDSFTYRICDDDGDCSTATVSITVTAINDAPVAVDDPLATDEDIAGTLNVLSNDTDPDGDTLFISVVGSPSNGGITNNGNNLLYTPNLNFNGVDVFTYTVSDGSLTDTALITVTVNPVNDPPTAIDDAQLTAEDTSEQVFVLVNDSDIDGDLLTVVSVSDPPNGTATTNGSSVTYVPDTNFDGEDIFTYTISDGALFDTATITITIIPINDPPETTADSYTAQQDTLLSVSSPGVLNNDTDVEGNPLTAIKETDPLSGTLTLAPDGSFTYDPNPGFIGTDSFTYRASDSFSNSPETTVTITVE